MDTMIPIIRQLHEADGDQARARVLLAMSDTILLKYVGVVFDACQRAALSASMRRSSTRILADGRMTGAPPRTRLHSTAR